MMKLIPQSEIEKAALNNSIQHYIMAYSDELHEYSKVDFEAGVEFAESKFEDLAIDFAKYILSMQVTKTRSPIDLETYTPPEFNLLKGELIVNGGELFQQFIKDRNEENRG